MSIFYVCIRGFMFRNLSRFMGIGAFLINDYRMGGGIFYNMRRTLSKKQLSLHKKPVLEQQLSSIQNMQLTADNILDKLLHPAVADRKQTQPSKFKPKFQKRDYQTLAHQNIALKQQLNDQRQTGTQLRFRLSEAQRKVKFLQGIQQKWQQSVQQGFQGKRLQVYTEILRKKIQQLNELYLSSEQKIKELKRLPHVSVFEEQSIEMEQLKREAIRLKAIIASMSGGEEEEDDPQNKFFLKRIKFQNEQQKSIIRLLENEKNLLKSRQNTQKRQIADFRKEIDDLRKKLTVREAEIEKIQNQTKNILLKKAFQLKADQEKRENQEIDRLKSILEEQRMDLQKLEDEKEQLSVECHKLKKNQKIIESRQASQQKEINDLRREMSKLQLQLTLSKQKSDRTAN